MKGFLHIDTCSLDARECVAKFLEVDADEVVLVPNATHALNTVLRNFEWREGDVLIGGVFPGFLVYETSRVDMIASYDDLRCSFENDSLSRRSL